MACWRSRSSLGDLREWSCVGRTAVQRLFRELLDEDKCGAGTAEISALPPHQPASLEERLFAEDAEQFVAKPKWEGQPRETSPLTRRMERPLVVVMKRDDGYGLGARLVAYLDELSQIPARMLALLKATDETVGSPNTCGGGNGVGVAQVEAGRGLLVHAVQMTGDKVGRYRILAPTEWNFHPEGAAAHGLASIAGRGRQDCAMLARLFVAAVDPCVGVDVRVH